MIRSFLQSSLLAFVLFVSATPASGDVLNVRGPDPDHDEIVDAVAAASDGDTIRVWGGSYSNFAVVGKELRIVATSGTVIVNGLVRLRDMPRASTLRVSGLEFRGNRDEALLVYDNQGQVVLQDCSIFGGPADLDQCDEFGFGAVGIRDSAQVCFVGCVVRGGYGPNMGETSCQPASGAAGLTIADSDVALYGGSYRGGGGSNCYGPFGYPGGNGGTGLLVGFGSEVWLMDAEVVGGGGGEGSDDSALFSECYNGGRGGDALFLDQVGGGATVWRLAGGLTAGVGGPAGFGSDDLGDNCLPGSDGLPLQVEAGNAVNDVMGDARSLDAPSIAFDDTGVAATVLGQPGDRVRLVFSHRSAFRPRRRGVFLLGTLLWTPTGLSGTVPASGVLDIQLPHWQIAELAMLDIGLQAVVVDSGGGRHLSGVRWVTLLDALHDL